MNMKEVIKALGAGLATGIALLAALGAAYLILVQLTIMSGGL